jgi:branched-chain amino acid transport system ATP-binding protein
MSFFEVHGLVSGYGRVPVVHGIDLALDEGELLSVIGANGAGKTTLMRTIAGINRAFEGKIVLDGRDITKASPSVVARAGIAHVPENRRVFPLLSVAENLKMGGFVRRRDRRGVAEDMHLMYERFPILDRRQSSFAGTLSGGEQQMLAIAMALMSRPRLLMLDEPSLGLAPIVVKKVFDEIKALKDHGTTVLLNEQFAEEALRVADRAIVLKLGHVALLGPAADVRRNDSVKAAYLGI